MHAAEAALPAAAPLPSSNGSNSSSSCHFIPAQQQLCHAGTPSRATQPSSHTPEGEVHPRGLAEQRVAWLHKHILQAGVLGPGGWHGARQIVSVLQASGRGGMEWGWAWAGSTAGHASRVHSDLWSRQPLLLLREAGQQARQAHKPEGLQRAQPTAAGIRAVPAVWQRAQQAGAAQRPARQTGKTGSVCGAAGGRARLGRVCSGGQCDRTARQLNRPASTAAAAEQQQQAESKTATGRPLAHSVRSAGNECSRLHW